MNKALKVYLILGVFTVLAGCQSQSLINVSASPAPHPLSGMLSKARDCIEITGNEQQCYQNAFPRRCQKLSIAAANERKAALKKLSNCLSTCEDAPLFSRSFGACSTVI
jgi:hypothetical protein